MSEQEPRFEDDMSSTPGALLGASLTLLFEGIVIVVLIPLWVPALIIHKVRHWNDPKPKYRGTVRPMGGPIR